MAGTNSMCCIECFDGVDGCEGGVNRRESIGCVHAFLGDEQGCQ
jgi:hypothetical protein